MQERILRAVPIAPSSVELPLAELTAQAAASSASRQEAGSEQMPATYAEPQWVPLIAAQRVAAARVPVALLVQRPQVLALAVAA